MVVMDVDGALVTVCPADLVPDRAYLDVELAITEFQCVKCCASNASFASCTVYVYIVTNGVGDRVPAEHPVTVNV